MLSVHFRDSKLPHSKKKVRNATSSFGSLLYKVCEIDHANFFFLKIPFIPPMIFAGFMKTCGELLDGDFCR